MTEEQVQLLMAATIETLMSNGQPQYSGPLTPVIELLCSDWPGHYTVSDARSAIGLFKKLGAAQITQTATGTEYIAIGARQTRVNLVSGPSKYHFNPRKVFPLLVEYASYGDSWLREMWAIHFELNQPSSTPPMVIGLDVPASNRLVSLDHNLAPYREVQEGLIKLAEAVRGANDAESAQRLRVIKSISAAQQLWEASELRVIQVKIGLILAIEDAIALIGNVAVQLGVALLVDVIKAFVKTQSGIDLDKL